MFHEFEDSLGLHLYFIVIAATVAVIVRFSTGSFTANAMDYLVVGIVFLIPSLPIYESDQWLIGVVALDVVMLFCAIEVLLSQVPRRASALNLGILATLAIPTEPPRESRRLFGLSHAAIAV